MIFFDLDGTLTESRQKMTQEMKDKLKSLDEPYAVISGGSKEQMEYQLDGLDCFVMAQSGNHCKYWVDLLSNEQVDEIKDHIDKYSLLWGDKNYVENRGSQVTICLVGFNVDVKVKSEFDPGGRFRNKILELYPFESETLTARVAGTGSIDYTLKNGTKGKNVQRLIDHVGLTNDECRYYGDALFPGGNDETVLGVIECIQVDGPDDLLTKL